METDQRLGQGLYALSELSLYLRLTGLTTRPQTVSQWVRHGLTPSSHQRGEPTYSFYDLVSLMVVGKLRGHGVKLSSIHDAEEHMANDLGYARPFATEKIMTDGANVLFKANPEIEQQLTAANRRGQEVSVPALGDLLKNIGYFEQLACSWEPHSSVRLDPEIQFGSPTIIDTRIPTAQLFSMHEAGDDVESLANLYELKPEVVSDAIRFERELAKAA